MDRGAWQATVHGVAKSRTRLSGFTYSLRLFCRGTGSLYNSNCNVQVPVPQLSRSAFIVNIYPFDCTHPSGQEVIAHYGLICTYLLANDVEHFFNVLIDHLFIFSGPMIIQIFSLFLMQVFIFLLLSYEFFIYYRQKSIRYMICSYFFPLCRLPFISLSRFCCFFSSVQLLNCVRLFATLWAACSTPGSPVHHQLPELPQTHVCYSF